jgi:two-component system sensor histidine kinase UhpB
MLFRISAFLLIAFFVPVTLSYSLHKTSRKVANTDAASTDSLLSEIEHVVLLMNNEYYDSAYTLSTTLLIEAEAHGHVEYSYLLHSLQAEIFYYKSLFHQGLRNAYRALRLSEKLKDDLYIGSAENLIGLLLLNLNNHTDAERYLRFAFEKIPSGHSNRMLSHKHQAASNLAELFFNTERLDSSLKYSVIAINEAALVNSHRGTAIAYHDLSKTFLKYNLIDSAVFYIAKGKRVASESGIDDVMLFLIATESSILNHKGNTKSMQIKIAEGLSIIENKPFISTYSKVEFLKTVWTMFKDAGMYKESVNIQSRINSIEAANDLNNQEEQVRVLQRYFNNEKEMEVAESIRQKNEAQARLNRTLFFMTIVFGVLLLTLVGLVALYYTQRVNIKQLELKAEEEKLRMAGERKLIEERLEAANTERNRIAKELHDDVGSSLSSIMIYADVALKDFEKDNARSKLLLQKLSEKGKELSNNMSDIIWAVYSKNDSFRNMLMRMKNFAFEITSATNVDVHFHSSYQLDDRTLHLELRKNIYYIFKEAFNNAVKHSKSSRIDVSFLEHQPGQLTMLIADNGSGFNKDNLTKNNGFYTMQARTAQLSGKIDIESSPAGGTKVKVVIPINV